MLLVGEIYVDFVHENLYKEAKMRLGGIVHAARGLWASRIRYSVAAICPQYLISEAENYLKSHGCDKFILLGLIEGAPNVILISDVREVGHQGYEEILRDKKLVFLENIEAEIKPFNRVVIYPGKFSIPEILKLLGDDAIINIDIAYDIKSLKDLEISRKTNLLITISTSSDLFLEVAKDEIEPLLSMCEAFEVKLLLLKENRGGSRLFDIVNNVTYQIPAILGETVNSVGVGDVFTAVFTAFASEDPVNAAWRGMQVATNYAQTTYPDDLYQGVNRDLALPLEVVMSLGGTVLSWHDRPNLEIYLAAPDFTYVHKPEIDAAISSLEYHNFKVRRPVQENGEAKKDSSYSALQEYYHKDIDLLDRCVLVFSIPILRDPGTLIEMGMAIAKDIPVITYDPRDENRNTMAICGSKILSSNLDTCLNKTFETLSMHRSKS